MALGNGMRLAVICLAYLQDDAGVAMLARYFARLPADLYVHVDAKVPNDRYRAAAERHGNLRLLPERETIWWGGFNTVRAIVGALRHCMAIRSYDRYLLVTEDTIPLLPPQALRLHLQQDVEFMHSYAVPGDPDNWVRRRYENFYYYDSIATNPRAFPPEHRVIAAPMAANLQRLERLRQRGKCQLPNLKHGSSWWALTEAAVTEIVDAFDRDTWLRESFEFSAIPEEQYFQTILDRVGWRRPFHPFMHTDFSRTPAPYVYRTASEIASVQGSPACMLRKVDMNSPDILGYFESLLTATA